MYSACRPKDPRLQIHHLFQEGERLKNDHLVLFKVGILVVFQKSLIDLIKK